MEMLKVLSRVTSGVDYENDALDLLREDHAALVELFDRYEQSNGPNEKRATVFLIIRLLAVHMRLEEELFYPMLRKSVEDHTAIDTADVEHAMTRALLADLNHSGADTPHFDAKVRSLTRLVERHLEDEEESIFREARASGLDLVAVGGQLEAYRAALESRYELDIEGKELDAFLSTPTVLERAAEGDPR